MSGRATAAAMSATTDGGAVFGIETIASSAPAAVIAAASLRKASASPVQRRMVLHVISAGSRPMVAHDVVQHTAGGGEPLRVRSASSSSDGRSALPAAACASCPLHRCTPAAGVCTGLGLFIASVRLVVATVERGAIVGQQALQHGEPFLEPVEPLGHRAEIDAEGLTLLLVPSGADAQLEPAVPT